MVSSGRRMVCKRDDPSLGAVIGPAPCRRKNGRGIAELTLLAQRRNLRPCKARVSIRVDNSSKSDGHRVPHSTSYPGDYVIGGSLVNVPSGGVVSEAGTACGKGWDAIRPAAVYARCNRA
jgi:hypothetical protein